MARKGKKRQRLRRSSNMDRIVALPDHIIHHILSLLPPNEAMMTTFLSRAWRDMWIGLPSLNLGKTLFHQTLQNTHPNSWQTPKLRNKVKSQFLDFVDQTLKKRCNHYSNTNTNSLNLYVPNLCMTPEFYTRLDRWIDIAINDFKVEELFFRNESVRRTPYKFVINACAPTLPLKRLELYRVTVGPEIIDHLSQHCPLIERLCFRDCSEITKVTRISGFPKLVQLVLHYDYSDSFKLQIDVPNLRFLEYKDTSRGYSRIKADTHDVLNDLRLWGVIFKSHWLLPALLANLELHECKLDTENVVITSNYLKTLSILDCIYPASVKVMVDAPRLEYFSFSGQLPSFFEFNHSGLEKANFCWDTSPSQTHEQIVGFLAKINPCKELEIVKHSSPKHMIIGLEQRQNWNCPLPDVKNMKLELRKKSWSKMRLNIGSYVDSLLWLSPCPLTMMFHGYQQKNEQEFKLLKFKYYEGGNKDAEKSSKCECLPGRSWQNNLEEVSIENHMADGEELKNETGRKMRAEDDSNIKAFFENARQKEKIKVKIIS